MKVAVRINQERSANAIRDALLGLRCWHVACGGCVGSLFQLALGGKVRRDVPLRNPKASGEYRMFEGASGLAVWCSWRLEIGAGPITSSEDGSPGLARGLTRLAGRTIVGVALSEDWLLRLDFSGGLRLSVFPDHVDSEWTLGNWNAWTPKFEYAVGTDLTCQVSRRRII